MIRIEIENPDQPEVAALLAASDAYMASLYPSESNHMLDLDALRRPEVAFLVARVEGRAVACGAVVSSGEGWAEVKRMFVTPQARGLKLGRRLLERLEAISRERGERSLCLEMGARQPEALALYRSAGFVETGPFGSYRPDPVSVFMQKHLSARDEVAAGPRTAPPTAQLP